MKENSENQLEKIDLLCEQVKGLPIKMQTAIFWAVEYFDVLEEIGKKSELTLEEIQRFKADMLAEKSYAAFLLAQITEYVKNQKKNEE